MVTGAHYSHKWQPCSCLYVGGRLSCGPPTRRWPMRLRVLILLGLTLCWPTVGFPFTADKRDTLRGLREVSVLVEYLPDDVEREGLSREHLKRDIEGWDSPGKSTGVGCHALHQGIFSTQGLNPDLPHCRQMPYR